MIKNVIALLGLILCASSLSACAVLKSRSVKELLRISTKDGDRRLREPMRPIRDETRVLIFALDGIGHDDFLSAVRAGQMPNTQHLMGSETEEEGVFVHAFSAEDVLSVLPSSTTAAWVSAFTGQPPAHTGVPGNEWFDRAAARFHAPAPISVDRRYQVLRGFTRDLLGESIQVPTLHELASVRSHVSLLNVHRGADMLNIPEIEPFGTLFNAAVKEAVGADSARYRFYEKLDQVSIASLEESLGRYGIADLQTVYFPGVDLYTHISADPLGAQQRYLKRVIDPGIGRVLDLYREAGVLDSTYVLFVSDHGQTPVQPDEDRSLWREGDGKPPALLGQAGFRVRSWGLETEREDDAYQAVLAYQGGMAFVYLADRSTCAEPGMPCDWQRPPRRDEDLMVAVKAFDQANRSGVLSPAMASTLDLILAREGASPGDDSPPFRVWEGDDLVPIADYVGRHERSDLLDLERRLADLGAGPHGYLAGDIVLFSRMRTDEPVETRTYFGEPYFTWHGSANALDSRVVFVLARPGASGAELSDRVHAAAGSRPTLMDLTPLVLSLLER